MNKEVYPEHFTETDKIDYDILVSQAKQIYPKMDEWCISLAVIAHINNEKGMKVPATQEEIDELKNKYDLSNNTLYETPEDENIVIQPKEIIYA